MITKGTGFIPVFTGGNGNTHFEPTIGLLNGKIVYSKYVVFGTTYNTQDFTFEYNPAPSAYDEPLTWQCEVLGKAGTDAENGDYYYFGMLNDIQGVASYYNPGNIVSQLTSGQWQVGKVRDIIYSIPFGNDAAMLIDWYVRGNQYINSIDFTYIPRVGSPSFFLAFASSTIANIIGLADFMQECSGTIHLGQIINNCPNLIEADFRGFTKWQNVTNPDSMIVSCPNLEHIYFSEAESYNDRYVSCNFSSLPKLKDLDFAKLKWHKLSNINIGNNIALETVTGLQGVQLKAGASVQYCFNGLRHLTSDPHVETWVGEDGVSKPIVVASNGPVTKYCGADVPIADRTWIFDFSGWTLQALQNGLIAIGNLFNTSGYKVRIDSLFILPYNNESSVTMAFRGILAYQTPNTFYNTAVDFDAMIPTGVDAVLQNNGLYQMMMNNTVVTSVKLGNKIRAYQTDGEVPNNVLSSVFTGSVISSIDIKAQHINFYRQQTVVVQGQSTIQTSLNPLIVGDAVNWTNATQINDFIDSLVATQSKQYQVNNLKIEIQFNAAQRDIIQARSNWSTDAVTISNNGWDLQFP